MHKDIIPIATAGARADSRQHTENLNACLTLDDLQVMKDGYELSRPVLHLRLLPRRQDTAKGKRHVETVSIKIRRAKNSLCKIHADASFTFAAKEYLKNIASMFRPDSVLVLSIDDKTRVPIEITAATKQALMVMHMRFVAATLHKLNPSVFAACEITKSSSKSDFNTLYSGPMHMMLLEMANMIAVRLIHMVEILKNVDHHAWRRRKI